MKSDIGVRVETRQSDRQKTGSFTTSIHRRHCLVNSCVDVTHVQYADTMRAFLNFAVSYPLDGTPSSSSPPS